jgi:hypothetical protein
MEAEHSSGTLLTSTTLQGVTSEKTAMFTVTAVKIYNLTILLNVQIFGDHDDSLIHPFSGSFG